MWRWWLVALAGCYSPHPSPGAPCASGEVCPSGLSCINGLCVLPGTGVIDDAPPDNSPAIDSPRGPADARVFHDAPLDAPPDAPPSGLVAWWKFDDDPANGALDSTGNGHTGTCIGTCPTLVTGKIGMAYAFDAAQSEALVVPDSTDFRGNVTIAAWFYANSTTTSLSMLAKPVSTGTDDSWQLEVLSSDQVSFSGGVTHYLDSPSPVTLQVWHHAAGTWDGTTKRLYIDGVEVASVATTTSYDTHVVYLGADNNSGTTTLYFSGMLDDLRVYSRVLSASEIAVLAQ